MNIHPEKSRILDLNQEGKSLNFLGYTITLDTIDAKKPSVQILPAQSAIDKEKEKLAMLLYETLKEKDLIDIITESYKQLDAWRKQYTLSKQDKHYKPLYDYLKGEIEKIIRYKTAGYRPTCSDEPNTIII